MLCQAGLAQADFTLSSSLTLHLPSSGMTGMFHALLLLPTVLFILEFARFILMIKVAQEIATLYNLPDLVGSPVTLASTPVIALIFPSSELRGERSLCSAAVSCGFLGNRITLVSLSVLLPVMSAGRMGESHLHELALGALPSPGLHPFPAFSQNSQRDFAITHDCLSSYVPLTP